MTTTTSSPTLVPNPNAFMVRVGSFVTERCSCRRVFVAKKDATGAVWEPMESDPPSLRRNGGHLADNHLRYLGNGYEEFEPAFIAPERLRALLDPSSASAVAYG